MDNKKPLVSVVLPTFNRVKFLEKAIESVLGQDYKNLELIVVDDASTDGTPEFCFGCKKTDPRIKIIRNEKNLGFVGLLIRG